MAIPKLETFPIAKLSDTYNDSIYSDTLTIEQTSQSFSYRELMDRYRTSRYGVHHLTQKPRFHEFLQYARADILDDGGANVCPVGHMDVTYENGKRLFHAEARNNPRRLIEEYSPWSVQLVRFTLGVHDQEECTEPSIENSVDDIPYGKKTPQDRINATGVRRQINASIYRDVPQSLLNNADLLMRHKVDDDNQPAHTAVEGSHWLGDFETGIHLGELALQQVQLSRTTPSDARFLALRSCALEVTSTYIQRFEAHPPIASFSIIDQTLGRNEQLIEDIRYELGVTL